MFAGKRDAIRVADAGLCSNREVVSFRQKKELIEELGPSLINI